jgi:hypothetical protein
MISVNMGESSDQIQRALLSQARGDFRNTTVDLSRWHEFDKTITESIAPVTIPYAEILARSLPTTHFRVQRDFPQVLSLIQAHALLHMSSRRWTAEGKILATLRDYAEVYNLVNGPLSQGLEKSVTENIRQVVEGVSALIERSDLPVLCSQGNVRGLQKPSPKGDTKAVHLLSGLR